MPAEVKQSKSSGYCKIRVEWSRIEGRVEDGVLSGSIRIAKRGRALAGRTVGPNEYDVSNIIRNLSPWIFRLLASTVHWDHFILATTSFTYWA
ncbi:hypothetical protein BC937DRAFT_89245 [Endogone sp. FLAS-F59071]|nr:hypothetical protein BC937DRAFT_89245 [Endogone sp. FLAS-F59071]|eukprot:RUS22429.1 hypothetical protein BC937DRAFT_89245 [Endogone sp. FLAS-F59071]